jgi:quercetin dioxygenase-like cupin family protein
MKLRTGLISACALAVAIGGTTVGLLGAQQKQEYKPRAEVKKLVETALHGVDGKRVTIAHFKLPPGFVGGKHYHSGPVFVYVAKGVLTVEEEGKAQQTFRAGQVYTEPIGQKMVGRNVSSKEPLDLVVFQVHGEGEPLMYKAD